MNSKMKNSVLNGAIILLSATLGILVVTKAVKWMHERDAVRVVEVALPREPMGPSEPERNRMYVVQLNEAVTTVRIVEKSAVSEVIVVINGEIFFDESRLHFLNRDAFMSKVEESRRVAREFRR